MILMLGPVGLMPPAGRKWMNRCARSTPISPPPSPRGPVCWASGRCSCNFEKFGHRLYVTALETAWCVTQLSNAAPAQRALLSLPVSSHAADARSKSIHSATPMP